LHLYTSLKNFLPFKLRKPHNQLSNRDEVNVNSSTNSKKISSNPLIKSTLIESTEGIAPLNAPRKALEYSRLPKKIRINENNSQPSALYHY
jgi:hypothetical protein